MSIYYKMRQVLLQNAANVYYKMRRYTIITTKWASHPRPYLHSCLKIEGKGIILQLIWKKLFLWAIWIFLLCKMSCNDFRSYYSYTFHFSLSKMTSNDFHFYYSYTLTTQIDFCYIDAIFQSIDLHVNRVH